MQSKLLQNRLRVAHQRFVLFVAFFRMRELEQFHFLELVLPLNPARVFSRSAGLAAETRRPRAHLDRQRIGVERLVAR